MTNIKQVSAPKLKKVWIDETGGLRVDLDNDYHFRVEIKNGKNVTDIANAFFDMSYEIATYARTRTPNEHT